MNTLQRAKHRYDFWSSNDHLLLDFGNRLARVETLWAGARAVHDGMATVQLEVVVESLQAIFCRLITRVDDPAVGLHQHGRAEVLVAVPPVPAVRSVSGIYKSEI
jgi:hypothetical protein